jgi:hypothetical protein
MTGATATKARSDRSGTRPPMGHYLCGCDRDYFLCGRRRTSNYRRGGGLAGQKCVVCFDLKPRHVCVWV